MNIDEVKDTIDELDLTEYQCQQVLDYIDKRIAELEGKIH